MNSDTPICHLTIGPSQYGIALSLPLGLPQWMPMEPTPRPCLGSRCSAWADANNGRGWCDLTDALHCNSWPDPAKPQPQEPPTLPERPEIA